MTNPTEPATSRFPDIQAFLRTLVSYPDEVVAAAAVQAADEIEINRAERNYWRDRAQSAEASFVRMENLVRELNRLLDEHRDRAERAEASLSQLQADAGGERLRALLERCSFSLGSAYVSLHEEIRLALSGGTEKQRLSPSVARVDMTPPSGASAETEGL